MFLICHLSVDTEEGLNSNYIFSTDMQRMGIKNEFKPESMIKTGLLAGVALECISEVKACEKNIR